MANRRFDSSWVIGARLVEIMGSFGTNGSSAPVAASVKGLGFGYAPIAGVMTLQSSARPGISGTPGITHTATGTYLVTFDDSYQDLVYAGFRCREFYFTAIELQFDFCDFSFHSTCPNNCV